MSGAVVNVAGGKRTSLNQLFRAICGQTGVALEAIHEPPRGGDVRHSLASLERARELLGFVAAVELEEGLARTIESLR